MILWSSTVTKVIIVVSVIVVGILDVDFEPQDLVAPSGDPVVEAHLQNCVDDDGDDDKVEDKEGVGGRAWIM